MRGGFQIFDADITTRADLLEPYLSAAALASSALLSGTDKKPKGRSYVSHGYTLTIKRRLGAADDEAPENQDYMGATRGISMGSLIHYVSETPARASRTMECRGRDVNLNASLRLVSVPGPRSKI